MKKLLITTLFASLSTAMSFATFSFSTLANVQNSNVQSGQYLADGETPITICYYQPKVWSGPGQRGFSIELEGHSECAEEYGFGRLYAFSHTYR